MNPAALLAALSGDLPNAIAASTPGGIEAQEAAGQAAMVACSQLPKDGCDREVLQRLGFVLGANVDDLFVAATLPQGWCLRPTSHSMHTDLVDDHGRTRASIFYKAAFYDRKAHMRLTRRFNIDAYVNSDAVGNPAPYPDATHGAVVVKDGDEIVYVAGTVCNDNRKGKWDEITKLEKVARAWLDERYPDWNNVEAYW